MLVCLLCLFCLFCFLAFGDWFVCARLLWCLFMWCLLFLRVGGDGLLVMLLVFVVCLCLRIFGLCIVVVYCFVWVLSFVVLRFNRWF